MMQRLTIGAVAAIILVGCGTPSSGSSSPSASTSPSPTPAACSTSGPASSNWPVPQQTPAITSVTASGDLLTMTFGQGTPAYDVSTQPTAQFTLDPSGQPVTLTGAAGVRIVLHGFRGDMQSYSGPKTVTSQGPVLLQVRELGDYEGVVTWGAGVSASACTVVTASGSALTFRFVIVQPAA